MSKGKETSNVKLLTADRLITGDGESVIHGAAICLDEQGEIVEAGTEEELLQRYPEASITRYEGSTILPGLIDLHLHIGYYWDQPDFLKYNDGLIALMAAANLKEALSHGVTTIRDANDPGGLCETMKHAQRKKFIVAPRIYHVNKGIIMTGGHAWQLEAAMREANGPWEVRTAVREQVKAGADWIKILTSHRTPTPEFTQEELDAAVDEARRLGRKSCVHASLPLSIDMAIKAGFDTIEHGTFMSVEQAKKMADKGIVWVPTLITFFQIAEHYRRFIVNTEKDIEWDGDFYIASEKAYRENFAHLLETGVKVATGTDIVLPGYPLAPVADEIALMVELGMNPIQAIQAATQTAAEVLDQGHRIGLLETGYLADILVVKGDPLIDIKALQEVQEVFMEGKSVFARE
ncbi:amidohydrolase family protein [Paenibacillus beijingensis]|uniref:Amidohydrolase n=1 Tax=Paenibacillus beijingensis TaxID=1126833 RepID=A0A0D5NNG4_9BACL|nr:amidohydrolase family protein [Paenibacillus beijingensis]AJY76811.1 amidohydrolase [Paenibacillus beijingensis]